MRVDPKEHTRRFTPTFLIRGRQEISCKFIAQRILRPAVAALVFGMAAVPGVASAKSRHGSNHSSNQAFPGSIHMARVSTCHPQGEPTKKVYIVKQWHLPPKTATKGFKERYPQEKNQTAIYKALAEAVKRKQLQLIVAEGCEGKIDGDFTPTFNGWDFNSLHLQADKRGYEKIITLAPLKVEAKFGDKINVVCGDNNELIKEGNLRLSNLRGWTGFYVRLKDANDNDEKIKSYAVAAAEYLKVSKDTPREKLLPLIQERVKSELEMFRKSLQERDDSFVKVLSESDYTSAAVVIGGLHADDLKNKVEQAGLACEVLEPPGYQRADEKLVEDFQQTLESVKE